MALTRIRNRFAEIRGSIYSEVLCKVGYRTDFLEICSGVVWKVIRGSGGEVIKELQEKTGGSGGFGHWPG